MNACKLSIVFAVLASVTGVACGGTSDTGSESAAALSQPAANGAITVKGAKADRLLAALGAFDVVDNAMGGRASADVTQIDCLSSSNANLDETDPLFNVPQTSCTLEAGPGFTPAHREVKDDTAKAGVLFDALVAAAAQFADAGMGKSYISLKTASCAGHGPGAGSDPANPPPTTVNCTLTSTGGETVKVSGAKALRIAQGFGLAGATDQAMGGAFGTDASDLSCERRSNEALDESNPSYQVPSYSCSFSATGFDPSSFKLDDAEAKAHELSLALLNAGIEGDASMGGHSDVAASKVSCTKGPGAQTSCTLEQ